MYRRKSLSSAFLILVVLVVLVGVSEPLHAQAPLPVQVICVQDVGTFQPICDQTNQAVNASPQYIQAMSGNRYILVLNAKTCVPGDTINGLGCNIGDVLMSATYAAAISDPLSQTFPYHIATVPWVFAVSDAPALGAVLVTEGFLVAAAFFPAVVDEINSLRTSGGLEFVGDAILEEMKLRMRNALEKQTN